MRTLIVALVVMGLCGGVCGPAAPASKRVVHKKKAARVNKSSAKGAKSTKASKTASAKSKLQPSKTAPVVEPVKPAPEMEPRVSPKAESEMASGSPAPIECYSSLVIDATGLKLDKVMCPKVFRESGTEVWGTLKDLTDEDYDILQDRGMVAYAATIEEAKSNARAGTNPLVVKAVDTQGPNVHCNLVVADEDGNLILTANEKGKFLEKFNVILIRNENPPPPPPTPEDPPASPDPGPATQPADGG